MSDATSACPPESLLLVRTQVLHLVKRRAVQRLAARAGIPCRADFRIGGFTMQHTCACNPPRLCGIISRPPLGRWPPACLYFWVGQCCNPKLRSLRSRNFQITKSGISTHVNGLRVSCHTAFRYVGPLLLAATAAGTLKQLLSLRQYSAWITPASGVLLLSGGTYTLLSRLL